MLNAECGMMGASRGVELAARTKRFALAIIELFARLPMSPTNQVLGRQLLKSGTSIGAHYREGMRAKSVADFVSTLEGALQELEETRYWLELLVESQGSDRITGVAPADRRSKRADCHIGCERPNLEAQKNRCAIVQIYSSFRIHRLDLS
jgi:four helix bundle protein